MRNVAALAVLIRFNDDFWGHPVRHCEADETDDMRIVSDSKHVFCSFLEDRVVSGFLLRPKHTAKTCTKGCRSY